MNIVYNLLIYNSLLAFIIYMIFLALRGGGAQADLKPRYYNDARSQPETAPAKLLTRSDWIIMGAMTLFYFAVAIVNLGGFSAPETWWKAPTADSAVVFDFGSSMNLGRVAYNSNAMQHTENENWFDVYYEAPDGSFVKLDKQMKSKDFFKWNYLDLDVTTAKIKIVPVQGVRTDNAQTGYGFALNEMAFFEKDTANQIATKLDSPPAGAEKLLDEQQTAVYNANHTDGSYFDEIYFVRTAYEFLHGYKVYETTHPPLGKIIIAAGISLFGMVPFGWRILGMLSGVLMIPAIYIFAKKLLNSRFFAFFAAFLIMFDFMHFVQTRIATVDGFLTLFIILMYWFMFNYFNSDALGKDHRYAVRQLYLCGLMFGLGAAVKWIGLYGGAGLFFIYVLSAIINTRGHFRSQTAESRERLKRMGNIILLSVVFFILIPAAIYLLSYIPYYNGEGNEGRNFFAVVWSSQKLMFNYHSTLVATHPYQSAWWSWPLDIRPIKYYLGNTMKEGISSSITSFGNPAIWWAGFCAFFAAIFIAWKKADKKMVVIFAAIFFQYAPWILVTRATFIYHFFSTLPFVILCLAYVVKHLLDNRIVSRTAIYVFMGVVLAFFIIYFPLLSGVEISRNFILKLNMFSSWPF